MYDIPEERSGTAGGVASQLLQPCLILTLVVLSVWSLQVFPVCSSFLPLAKMFHLVCLSAILIGDRKIRWELMSISEKEYDVGREVRECH